jgi:hypothetical protein
MSTTTEGIDAVRDRLVVVETKLDMVLRQLDGSHSDHESRIRALEQRATSAPTEHTEKLVDHESRLRRLERTVWLAAGAAAAAGAGVGTFVASAFGG